MNMSVSQSKSEILLLRSSKLSKRKLKPRNVKNVLNSTSNVFLVFENLQYYPLVANAAMKNLFNRQPHQ